MSGAAFVLPVLHSGVSAASRQGIPGVDGECQLLPAMQLPPRVREALLSQRQLVPVVRAA